MKTIPMQQGIIKTQNFVRAENQAGHLHKTNTALSSTGDWSQRRFLGGLALTGCLAGLDFFSLAGQGAAPTPWNCEIGVCGSANQWDVIHKAGCAYVEENVGKLLNPKLPDAEFEKSAEAFKAKHIPVRACNGFLPGELKLVGPETKHDEVVAYATIALKRAKELGVEVVVLGSSSARKVPDGFDHTKANDQFVTVVRRLGQAAAAHGMIVAMESLNRTETNFGNTLSECFKLIKTVNHPQVKLVADMYHMLKENEVPDAILEAGSLLAHCHIAEKAQRTPPGTDGDDFKPYLRALKKLDYRGRISLECRWKKMADEITPAVAALKKQIEAVSAENG